jgi:hypothetical protein
MKTPRLTDAAKDVLDLVRLGAGEAKRGRLAAMERTVEALARRGLIVLPKGATRWQLTDAGRTALEES